MRKLIVTEMSQQNFNDKYMQTKDKVIKEVQALLTLKVYFEVCEKRKDASEQLYQKAHDLFLVNITRNFFFLLGFMNH